MGEWGNVGAVEIVKTVQVVEATKVLETVQGAQKEKDGGTGGPPASSELRRARVVIRQNKA